MIKIGIGIPTFNRKKDLENLINSIQHYTTKVPYQLFCGVDGSDDGTIEMLVKKNIEFTYGPKVGPSLNLNRIFRRFIHCNYILIVKDNAIITRDEWIELFISASGMFNLPHIIYGSSDDSINIQSDEKIGNLWLAWTDKYSPIISFYTRKALERVGGIDERFKGMNPYGQQEQFKRMIQAKLIPGGRGFPNLNTAKEFVSYNQPIWTYDPPIDYKRGEILYEKLQIENRQTKNIFRKL